MIKISASIVTYNENTDILKRVINNFLSIDLEKELVIVDNSPTDYLRRPCEEYDIVTYIFNGKNLGFGKGHNVAFKNLSNVSEFHLIINADTYFNGLDIKNLIEWMYINKDVSLSVPKVYFPDGTLQHTIRDVPTPMSLIKRRLNIKQNELNSIEPAEISEIPVAHGCFFIFNTEVFKKLGGFDERFFMYMEDIDITIRAKRFGKTVINPNYKIFHEYRRGSSKNFKLFLWHISSAISFFWKYK